MLSVRALNDGEYIGSAAEQLHLLRARFEEFIASIDISSIEPRKNGQVPSAAQLRGILQSRRLRMRFLDPRFCREPAWDMLLELYAARMACSRISVSSLCYASGAPLTTALRWVGWLEESGIVSRELDESDARRVFLRLSDEVALSIERYFRALPDFAGI